jgi:hypothetical protein
MGSAPSKPDPSRSVEVISAGISRTGTESMTLALEKLLNGPVSHGGIQSIHRTDGTFLAIYVNRHLPWTIQSPWTVGWPLSCGKPNDKDYNKTCIELWKAKDAGDTDRVKTLLKGLTAGYVGLTDVPWYSFAVALSEIYPNAKVVLVERDPTSWWRSVEHILKHAANPILPIMTLPVPGVRYFPAHFAAWRQYQIRLCREAGVEMGPGE